LKGLVLIHYIPYSHTGLRELGAHILPTLVASRMLSDIPFQRVSVGGQGSKRSKRDPTSWSELAGKSIRFRYYSRARQP
jgi:hypothetical protein